MTTRHLGPVAQKVDSAVHRINHDSVDSAMGFVNVYSPDSDLSWCKKFFSASVDLQKFIN